MQKQKRVQAPIEVRMEKGNFAQKYNWLVCVRSLRIISAISSIPAFYGFISSRPNLTFISLISLTLSLGISQMITSAKEKFEESNK